MFTHEACIQPPWYREAMGMRSKCEDFVIRIVQFVNLAKLLFSHFELFCELVVLVKPVI